MKEGPCGEAGAFKETSQSRDQGALDARILSQCTASNSLPRLSPRGSSSLMPNADAPYPLALLRARRERPRDRRAAEQRDEVATFQLIECIRSPAQPGPNCRIPSWRRSFSGYRRLFREQSNADTARH